MVNDAKLRKCKDCWLYGCLQNGDTISVFNSKKGEAGKEDSLKFRWSGSCANLRGESVCGGEGG